ncbi:protein-glutamate O-methyltransferase CheR [Herbaspirillum sp. WKF16]|uniref:CheR family methyltransferase n=1 Tax=Herbaspirillum sp. WKF16 TaxID=3028312 RepID=UPI0023A96D86|nr:protein-glutamate O-methyltransferase CheR [Herbaspirillum sp. WKF16]WDZ94621.1 protein-glutamate O-methyltransferase CheR [Herbaspirillum sp. WKF16]
MKNLDAIADTLKGAMGLDMATVGSSLIERVVRERMAALQIDDDQLYLAELLNSGAELQRLIELAVVPETWFFRDREAMLAVARLAREKLASMPAGQIRILSLPCSTGEEPYSVAMALFDAGVPASMFRIDAVDIRTRSLEIAAEGVYGRNSFRGRELAFRDAYFTRHEGDWRIDERVKAQVRFSPGNILTPDFMRNSEPYDFILCRNVLIYFEREVQLQVVALLERLMKDDAYIFVGPAEGGIMLSPRLASAGIALAFGFRKRLPEERPAVAPPPRPVAPLAAPALPVARRAASAAVAVATQRMPPEAHVPQRLLDRARQLANQGDFARAGELCEQALREEGASADAFYLMGLIEDAGGDAAAAQRCYRKAIYLQPAHHEALLHLAALLQAQGDATGARSMRQRAERAEKSSRPQESAHG